jgi:phosphate transport system protein
MTRLLDAGLEELATILLRMGEAAEESVRTAIRAFMNGRDLTRDVKDLSEMLDTMSVTVEEKVFELIVKYQPVASDLRIINSYMKIAYDFERYGRYAWDITLTQQRFADFEPSIYSKELMEKMAEKAMSMVRTSIEALRDNDGDLAKSLGKTENEVDSLYSDYLAKLSKTHLSAQCLISSLLVARYLERIADHATYIAESIYYIATGKKIVLR